MIEFQFQYSPFINLKVLHNYYAKSLKRDLKYVPSAETLKLIQNTGLILKETPEGLSLSYDVSEPDALLRFLKGNENPTFTFFLITSNYFFVNLTDMSPESVGSIFYFNSKTSKKGEDDNYLLHQKEFVSKEDRLNLIKGNLIYKLDGKKVDLALKDYEGNAVFSQTVEGQNNFTFPLEKLPQGYYTIYENGKEKQKFVFAGQGFQRNPIIAMVSIPLTGKDKKELLDTLERGEKLPLKHYYMHFQARSTYWKYYFVSKYKLPLQKSSIITNEHDVEFSGPEKVALSNGDTAYLFESKAPLPLKEIPSYKFKLSKSNKGDSGEAYMNRLPTPSPDSIKPESRDESSKVYSELIVYI